MFFRRKPKPSQAVKPRLLLEQLEAREVPSAAAGSDLLWRTYPTASAFTLHSDPGASQVIYLDFKGQVVSGTTWNDLYNSGKGFTEPAWSMDASRTTFSQLERTEIIRMWRMVSEDFAPFNVDVTTEDPGVTGVGIRAIMGPNPGTLVDPKTGTPILSGKDTLGNVNPYPLTGGQALLYSFADPVNGICFISNGDTAVFPEQSLPDTVSHQVGVSMGLSPDGVGTGLPGSSAYAGHGVGATSWGPIMGAPFGKSLTQWSMNTYPNADNPEDDLAIIASVLGYSADDYSDTMVGAHLLNAARQSNLGTTYGVIGQNTDSDFFQFYANRGPINIHIDPLFIGPNLDIQANLYDSTGRLLFTSNPVNQINATLAMNLPAQGAYFIQVLGTGKNPVLPTGYPNYGSLGNYRITGTVTGFVPPVTNSTFQVINPSRWSVNRATGTSDGDISITNISGKSFTGTFTFVFTLPNSVNVVAGPGAQSGANYSFTFSGTFAANQKFTFRFKLSNPFGMQLATGYNNFFNTVFFLPA